MKRITPFVFEDNLIISLSKEWLSIFDQIPKFDVEIKNNKLVLSSQIISRENSE